MKLVFALSTFFVAAACFGQLAPPNDTGVTMGHIHLFVKDPQAQRKFWVELMGAQPVKLGDLEGLKLPGILVFVQPGNPTGGTVGSAVGHIAFEVKQLAPLVARMKAAGVRGLAGDLSVDASGKTALAVAPEDVLIELTEAAIPQPVRFQHFRLCGDDVKTMQGWWSRAFGAKPGTRGSLAVAELPGGSLTFSETDPPRPTKGRVLDHIGFEVRNLPVLVKKLQKMGVKFTVPYKKVPSLGIAVVFFVDPWGVNIELTEGLDKL